jgi:hypothetical protein
MVLGSIRPLTGMSTRKLSGGGGGGGVKIGWQPHCQLWADCLENVGASTSHNPMDVHGLLQGLLYLLYLYLLYSEYRISSLNRYINIHGDDGRQFVYLWFKLTAKCWVKLCNHHHWQNSPFWAITFLRKFCRIVSDFLFFGFPNNYFFFLRSSRSNPSLEDQIPVFMSPCDRVTQLHPKATDSLFSDYYD